MSHLWIRACLEEQGESEEAQEGPYEANWQALLGSQLQGRGAMQAQQNMELEATFPILPTKRLLRSARWFSWSLRVIQVR
jgi:hypothetical protein